MKNIKFVIYLISILLISEKVNAEINLLQPGDFVGFTFWLVSMSMFAATIFFFIECRNIATAWRLPITIAGIITAVTFIHFIYMRSVWVQTGDVPIIYRYIDWIITFPLIAIEFYLVIATLKKISSKIFWKFLIAALIMMVSLCLGEAGYLQSFIALLIALLGWIFILYEIFSGEISKYFEKINDKHLVIIFKTMRMIIAAGWAIYPLGYIFGYLTTSFESGSLNAIYNLAEFVNKIAFCLIVWLVVVKNAPLSRR